jgi:hypothetical protein
MNERLLKSVDFAADDDLDRLRGKVNALLKYAYLQGLELVEITTTREIVREHQNPYLTAPPPWKFYYFTRLLYSTKIHTK